VTGADSPPDRLGGPLLTASWAVVAVQVLTSALGLATTSGRVVAAVTAGVVFAVGCVTFLAAYVIALGRSRTEAIGVGGLYFLAGDIAPAGVRRSFLAALAAQLVVGVAAGVAKPYTPLAFEVLVPMFGLGASGLWGARHGRFAARVRPGDRPGVAEPGTVASAHEPPDLEQNVPHG
jgi:hypothetical protein